MRINYHTPLMNAFAALRFELNRAVAETFNWTVQDGPFTGMKMIPQMQEHWRILGPAVIGCFEAEMHDTINGWSTKNYDTIVNVGYAEGYYLVGFGRLFPNAKLIGFESDPRHVPICSALAKANGVHQRIDLRGLCTDASLGEALAAARRPLILVDCEGAEVDILSEQLRPALAHADLLVECHDAKRKGVTPTLSERFGASHDVKVLPEGARNPNRLEALRQLPSLERWLLVWEGRGSVCSWMALESRRNVPNNDPAVLHST